MDIYLSIFSWISNWKCSHIKFSSVNYFFVSSDLTHFFTRTPKRAVRRFSKRWMDYLLKATDNVYIPYSEYRFIKYRFWFSVSTCVLYTLEWTVNWISTFRSCYQSYKSQLLDVNDILIIFSFKLTLVISICHHYIVK